jgi:acetyl-CoA C-acetyltransferase
MIQESVVLVSGVRTAIGKLGGGFRDVPASDLGAEVIKEAVRRSGVQPGLVDEVVMGCVGQIAFDAFIARVCAVKAGLPIEVTAHTVNRLCSSGLQAIVTGRQQILAGDAEVVVAGGVENMTRLPYYLRKARYGYTMGNGILEDGLITALSCPFGQYPMGITAENVAEKFNITREEQDEFALSSQQKAALAIAEGKFLDEIISVAVPQKKGDMVIVNHDEHPRPDTTIETLKKLKPAFKKDGTVTAGNSSGINDAAAAVVMMHQTRAIELGLTPVLRIVAVAVAAVEPAIMGVGPVPAIQKVLSKAKMKLEEIDLIELNEAFASQSVAVCKQLRLDMSKVNVNGGAIAFGHPIGASGAILAVKLMYEMPRRKARYGLVSLCIGGGQGLAVIFERL